MTSWPWKRSRGKGTTTVTTDQQLTELRQAYDTNRAALNAKLAEINAATQAERKAAEFRAAADLASVASGIYGDDTASARLVAWLATSEKELLRYHPQEVFAVVQALPATYSELAEKFSGWGFMLTQSLDDAVRAGALDDDRKVATSEPSGE